MREEVAFLLEYAQVCRSQVLCRASKEVGYRKIHHPEVARKGGLRARGPRSIEGKRFHMRHQNPIEKGSARREHGGTVHAINQDPILLQEPKYHQGLRLLRRSAAPICRNGVRNGSTIV